MNGEIKTKKGNIANKPTYGVYAGYSVFGAFFALAAGGIFLVLFGLYIGMVMVSIFGALISMVFLWPALGIFASARLSNSNASKYSFLSSCVKPRILDCGCGLGRRAIQLAKQLPTGGLLTGIDIFDKNSINLNSLERAMKNAEIEGVSDRVKLMKGSVTEIPFENEKFDVVTCMGVLHEMRSPELRRRAFREVYRVLKPDGSFYLTEMSRRNMVKYMGVFGLMFKDRDYWNKQLTNNHFKILSSKNSENGIEILSKKE